MHSVLSELRQAVEALSKPADEQLAYLSSLFNGTGVIVDELALEFDDALRCSLDSITGPVRQQLMELDGQLSKMSGPHNAMLWNEDALRNREEWNEVRRLAKLCLNCFDGR